MVGICRKSPIALTNFQVGEAESRNASPGDMPLDSIAVIVPTLNAHVHFDRLFPALGRQGIKASQVLVIDSSSDDDTVAKARAFGARTHVIARKDFNHGGTRELAATLCPDEKILVYLTQDAIPARDDAILRLSEVFTDPLVGMAFGRQLPRAQARGIERYARLRNYPANSQVRSASDRNRLGLKTIFCSDSFAAYRRSALESVGSFPRDVYFAEDQIVAARMLLSGLKLAYVAEAHVVHSHCYTIGQDFKRYFDVGVFHGRNRWLLDIFGTAEGEGLEFVKSELSFLLSEEPLSIPSAVVRTFTKYLAYRLGLHEANLPAALKMRFSMQPSYWRTKMQE
jgi:rhamnosyltransferase